MSLGLGRPRRLMNGLLSATDRGRFFGVGKHGSSAFRFRLGNPYGIGNYLSSLTRLTCGSLNRDYRGNKAHLRFVHELDEPEQFDIREVAAVALSVDFIGERLRVGGEGLLVGCDPKEAKLLGGPDTRMAATEDAGTIGLPSDVDGLSRVES